MGTVTIGGELQQCVSIAFAQPLTLEHAIGVGDAPAHTWPGLLWMEQTEQPFERERGLLARRIPTEATMRIAVDAPLAYRRKAAQAVIAVQVGGHQSRLKVVQQHNLRVP